MVRGGCRSAKRLRVRRFPAGALHALTLGMKYGIKLTGPAFAGFGRRNEFNLYGTENIISRRFETVPAARGSQGLELYNSLKHAVMFQMRLT